MHELHLLDSPSSSAGNHNDLYQLQQIQAKKETLEASTGILELGLAEFPGCALLHLYYLESLGEYFYHKESEALHHLMKSQKENGGADDSQSCRDKLTQAFQATWNSIGIGSHVNEGVIVSEVYRLHGSFLIACLSCEVHDASKDSNTAMDIDSDNICCIIRQLSVLCSKWSKTPMGDGSNDEMIEDFNTLWDEALSILIELKDEKHVCLLNQQKIAILTAVDDYRRATSSLTNVMSAHENDIDVAMTNEGILFPQQLLQRQDNSITDESVGKHLQVMKRNDRKWDTIITGKDTRWLLGLGASETSRAFIKYTSFLQRSYQNLSQKGVADIQNSLNDHIKEHSYSMISCVYERALSECPTVEILLMSHIKFLSGEWIRLRDKQEQLPNKELQELSNALQSICQRAIRNCPYSSNLFELRMTTIGLISTSNLEPDDITAVIQEASQLGFLSANREAMLSMRLVAINVVKRKLLSLVSRGTAALSSNGSGFEAVARGKEYDADDELDINPSSRKNKSKVNVVQYRALAPAVMEEVQDLIEDIRDMYEEADNYLFKSHAKWEEGKVCFWKHRCYTEAYLLTPIAFGLRNTLGNNVATNELADTETMKCFEKLVKTQKPCHPDSWREYLRYVGRARLPFLRDECSLLSPGEVGAVSTELRQTRGLYKRAMSSVRKAGKATIASGGFGVGVENLLFQRDYDLALSDLCQEYLTFERNFGSEESLSAALALVRSKMANYDDTDLLAAAAISPVEDNGKRKLESNDLSAAADDQMQEGEDAAESRAKRTKVKTNLKEPKKTDAVHKIRVGKMDYPAHPFTIHVSFLHKDTQDMDLVDAFRLTCGGIVHAKILREKHYGKGGHHSHGESKGCGLVQFEERMAVEKALAQNGELEIGGKKVKISLSHLPAVGIVPQGMHRVNPKGDGKVSKRNQLKKKTKPEGAMDVDDDLNHGGEVKGESDTIDGTATKPKNKYRTSSSPGSIKLDSLSFKPRAVKPKPKMSLGNALKK